jgi:hypothetical protein
MTKLKRKALWRRVERAIRSQRERRVGIRALARRFHVAPSTLSRGLRSRGVRLGAEPEGAFPWECADNKRYLRAAKCSKALALYFLGLNTNVIESLVGLKAQILGKYLLSLTVLGEDAAGRPYRTFSRAAEESLVRALERAFGMGEIANSVFERWYCWKGDYFPAESTRFLAGLRNEGPYERQPQEIVLRRKLRKILDATIERRGLFLCIKLKNGKEVRVRVSHCELPRSFSSSRWFRSHPEPSSDCNPDG